MAALCIAVNKWREVGMWLSLFVMDLQGNGLIGFEGVEYLFRSGRTKAE
jgi:hypothetical protein